MRPEIFARLNDGWQPPTPAEVRQLLDERGLTAYRAAQLIGVAESTIGNWMRDVKHGKYIEPKYAYWRLLVLECGR